MLLEQMKNELELVKKQMKLCDVAVEIIDNNIPFFKNLLSDLDIEDDYTLQHNGKTIVMEICKHTDYEGNLTRVDFIFNGLEGARDAEIDVEVDDDDFFTGRLYLATISNLQINLIGVKNKLESKLNTINRQIQLHGKSAIEADILNHGYSSNGFMISKEGNDRIYVELKQAYTRTPLHGHGGTLEASMEGINVLELKLKQSIIDLQKLRLKLQEEINKKDV